MNTKNKHNILYAAILIFAFLLPVIFQNFYYQMLFIQTLINIVVVIGLNFITGLTGQMNLGTAGIFSLGAYSSALLVTKLGVSPWWGFLLSIIVGILVGLALGYPSLRVKGVYLSLTTIGFSEIVRLVLTNWSDFTGGTLGVRNIPPFKVFGFAFDSYLRIYYLYLVIVLLYIVIAYRIVSSKWGRALKSIRDNSEASEACGLNVAHLKLMAFILATIYGASAGSLYTHAMGYIVPSTFSQDFSVNYIIMMVIGGIGTVHGGIIGACIVTLLPEFLRLAQEYYWIIFSVIALIFVMARPYGIVSLFSSKENTAVKFSPRTKRVRK